MKFEIYLEDYPLEIDGDFGMAIEYSYSHLTNPTVVTGDHSKTFTVKGTQHNNGVFGQIWRFDRRIVDDAAADTNVRVYFNPSKRTKCVMLMNGELFDRGYVRLDTVSTNKGVVTYSLTFFSELVDILRTLMSAKLRDLPFTDDLRHTLNAATIKEHYFNGDEFRYIMASNGLYDDFESSKWLTMSGNTVKVADVLNGIQMDETAIRQYRSYYQRPALMIKRIIDLIAQEHGIELDPAFFNAANPYYNDSVLALSQYKVNEQIAQEVGEASYSLENAGVGVYGTNAINNFLNPTSEEKKEDAPAILFKNQSGGGSTPVLAGDWSQTLDLANLGKNKGSLSLELEYRYIVTTQLPVAPTMFHNGVEYPLLWLEWEKGTSIPYPEPELKIGSAQSPFPFRLPSSINIANFGVRFIPYSNDSVTFVSCYKTPAKAYPNSYNSNWLVERNRWFQLKWDLFEPLQNELKEAYIGYRFVNQSGSIEAGAAEFNFPATVVASYGIAGRNGQYDIMETRKYAVESYILNIRPITTAPEGTGVNDLNNYYPYGDGFSGQPITVDESYVLRTDAIVDKNDIIDDEITQGDFLINYAKLFGLIFYTDDKGTAHLVTRNTFFRDPQIFDWTQKIDRSQVIDQKPVSFGARYLSMKYAAGETYYEELYRKHNGLEFGQQRINTGYEFNDDTTELIPDIPFQNTVMSKERTRMLVGSDYIVQQDEKVLPAMFQKDGAERNGSETKYNLLFYNGAIELKDANQQYYITDDDERMQDESIEGGKVCWIDPSKINDPNGAAYEAQNTYPQYSTVDASGRFSWHIGYPAENYAGFLPTTFPRSATIFANFWERYIREIYDVNNRVMTAYVQLTPEEIRKWSFADFVVIDGVLWHPNRIINFNPLGNRPTRVEFLRVSGNDALENAYKNGQTDMSESQNKNEEEEQELAVELRANPEKSEF